MLTFNIATVERRQASFQTVLSCLANQTVPCDRLNVAFSYQPSDDMVRYIKEHFLGGKLTVGQFTAAHKMFAFDDQHDDSAFLTFDDDILYPPNYSELLLWHLKARPGEVVGWHGMRFHQFPVKQFYSRTIYQYFDEVRETVPVHVLGTGCSALYVKTLRDAGFTYRYFDQFPPAHGNYNDMTLALFLREHAIRMTVLQHPKGWLHIIQGTQDKFALWKQSPPSKTVELSYLQSGNHL